MNIVISEDKAHKVSDEVVKCLTKSAKDLRRLFLVEEMVDTLKVSNMFVCALGCTLCFMGVVFESQNFITRIFVILYPFAQ